MNTFTELAISIRTSGGRVRRQVRPHPGVLSIALGLVVLACSARASYLKDKQVFWSRSQPLWEVSARIEWDRRRIQRTVDALKRALHERPSDYRLAVQLADLYFKLRNYAESTRLLKQYAHLSSPEDNMYGRLGLNYDLAHEYRKALGYYYKALQVDRQRFDIYVRIAQVRIKQGLPVDAARVLKKVLDVDPDYTPAVEEMKVVRRVIRSNAANVYRGANMVITYDDFHQLNEVDTFFPFMEAHASLLEERLKYHIPTIWIKIVPRVEHHQGPPAYYDDMQDTLLISEEAVHVQDHMVFGHELTWLYLTRITRGNAPRWLAEGLALVQARPPYLEAIPVRTTELEWIDLDRRLVAEKRFLDFGMIHMVDQDAQAALQRVYLQTRYLLEQYGWPKMRELLGAFRDGDTQFTKVIPDILHIKFQELVKRWNVYSLTHYYFRAPLQLKLNARTSALPESSEGGT